MSKRNMRLIDADALSRQMYHEAFEKDSDMQRWDSGCWIRYKLFENVLEQQPTIEPEYEELDFVQPHKKLSVSLHPEGNKYDSD